MKRPIFGGLAAGELTGYIGITGGKMSKEFHLSRVVTSPKVERVKKPRN
jgi:hypothetical protein